MPIGKHFRRRHRMMTEAMQRDLNPADQAQLAEVPTDNTNAPFIEPKLKPEFHKSDDGPSWFAVWNAGRNLATALKARPDELKTCEQSLTSARRAWGDEFAGPFTSQQEAQRVAAQELAASIQTRHRA